ncbi:hypothetical protein GWD52_20995 [Enterobacteriaceae bacterium 4M9]|nr:hypothetical protein [Enterobacteriaceae bacterium 4M9]
MNEMNEQEFIAEMSKQIADEYEEHVDLAAERIQPPITWEEFAGVYS